MHTLRYTSNGKPVMSKFTGKPIRFDTIDRANSWLAQHDSLRDRVTLVRQAVAKELTVEKIDAYIDSLRFKIKSKAALKRIRNDLLASMPVDEEDEPVKPVRVAKVYLPEPIADLRKLRCFYRYAKRVFFTRKVVLWDAKGPVAQMSKLPVRKNRKTETEFLHPDLPGSTRPITGRWGHYDRKTKTLYLLAATAA